MEEIDMNMTRIYDEMDKGFEILNKERAEEIEIEKARKSWELFLKGELEKKIDKSLVPFIQLIDFHYPEKPYQDLRNFLPQKDEYCAWFKIIIPDFALIATYVNMDGKISFWVINPNYYKNDIPTDDCWDDISIHKNIKDYRIALALAKQAWEHYLKDKEAGKFTSKADETSNPKAEVYEPVEEQFQVAVYADEYLENQIDSRLKYHNLI